MAVTDVYVELRATIADFQAKMALATDEIAALEKAQADAAAAMSESAATIGAAMGGEADETVAAQTDMVASYDRSSVAAARMAAGVEGAAERTALAVDKMYADTAAINAKFALQLDQAEAATATVGESMASTAATTSGTGAAIGKALNYAGLAAAAAGAESVKMAANFDTATTRLVTSAGEAAGPNGIGKVQTGLLQLMGQVGDTATDLEQGMYVIESAGQHGAQGLDTLKAAAQGAKDEGADLTTVAEGVSTVMNDYGPKVGSAADVTSKLVTAVGDGKTTMQEFAGALSNVVPEAANANISLAQVTGAVSEMTDHGMSANQATQDLAFTIRSLQNPSSVATNEMAAMGLQSNEVAKNLGKNGLTGTLNDLVSAITAHMGPAGTVLQDAFNQSKAAAADAQTELAKLPPAAQKLAQGFADGTVSLNDWRQGLKALPADQAALATQWQTLYSRSQGFNDTLKAGGPAAQTFQAALQKMTGGATGLTTALMLTGNNSAKFASNVTDINKATADAQGNVKGWSDIQATLNQKLDEAKGGAEAFAISVGQALMPAVTAMAGVLAGAANWLEDNQTVAHVLADVLIGVLAAAVLRFVATSVAGLARWMVALVAAKDESGEWALSTGANFLKTTAVATVNAARTAAVWLAANASILANQLTAGARWLAARIATYAAASAGAIASAAVTAAAWVAANAAMLLATGGIVLAIAALVAAGIWLGTHWQQVWSAIKSVAETVWHWFYSMVIQPWVDAFNWVKTVVGDFGDFFEEVLNGKVGGPAGKIIGDIINFALTPFRAAIDAVRVIIDLFSGHWSQAWSDIGNMLSDIYNHTIGPIVNLIRNALGDIGNVLGTITHGIGSAVSGLGKLLGFDEGGWVPGGDGAAQLAVVHGGEYVLSRDMLSGRTPVDGSIAQSVGNIGSPAAGGGSGLGAALPSTALAGTGQAVTVINVNVAGSAVTEKELAQTMQTVMARLGQHNSTTYRNFKR